MKVSENEFQKSIKLVNRYERLVSKHEGIIQSYYRELNTKIDYSVSVDPKFDSISIWDLDVNVYVFNILKGTTNIRTIGDLLKTSPVEVKKLRGMGMDRFNMLLESIDSYGVRWLQIHGVEKSEVLY